MRFIQVGGRPARGMVGMGVVEADYVQIALTSLPLNGDQLLGCNVITIMGGIGPRIAGPDSQFHLIDVVQGLAQQDPSTFMGIGLLAVLAQLAVNRVANLQHRTGRYSSQNRSLRYLSAESHKMVTMTASLPAAASSSPIRKLAATAAAAEMPNNRPSDRPKRLAIS